VKPGFAGPSFRQLLLLAFLLVAALLGAASLRGLATFEELLTQSRQGSARAVQLSADVQLLAERSIAMERAARQYLLLDDEALRQRFDEAAGDAAQTLDRLSGEPMQQAVSAWRERLALIRVQIDDHARSPARRDRILAEAFRDLDVLNNDLKQQARLRIEQQGESLLAGLEDGRQRFAQQVAGAILLSVLLALGFGLWLARPLVRLERAVVGLGENRLDQPIAIRGPADVRSLGRRLDWLRLRLVELEADKARFLRHVSHELKTPLAALREGVALLEEEVAGSLTDKQREVVRIIRQQTLVLQEQIEGLLRFNAAAFAAGELRPRRIELVALAREVAEQQRLHWQARQLRVDVLGQPLVVLADPDKLGSVLGNLLSNAVRFSPAGGVVRIVVCRRGGQVCLDVVDAGVGVAEADRDHVFEPFYRGQRQPDDELRGTGIGLSIVQEYVVAQGGRVLLLPSQTGAHFRVELPYVE